MSKRWKQHLLSEEFTLEQMITETPSEDVLDLMSLQARLKKVRDELSSMKCDLDNSDKLKEIARMCEFKPHVRIELEDPKEVSLEWWLKDMYLAMFIREEDVDSGQCMMIYQKTNKLLDKNPVTENEE
jgi:hypothetical protein